MSPSFRGGWKVLPLAVARGTDPLFRRSAIPKVHCADTRHSANVCLRVKVRVMVSLRDRLKVSGNSRLSE